MPPQPLHRPFVLALCLCSAVVLLNVVWQQKHGQMGNHDWHVNAHSLWPGGSSSTFLLSMDLSGMDPNGYIAYLPHSGFNNQRYSSWVLLSFVLSFLQAVISCFLSILAFFPSFLYACD
jgi:hypothetical protein